MLTIYVTDDVPCYLPCNNNVVTAWKKKLNKTSQPLIEHDAWAYCIFLCVCRAFVVFLYLVIFVMMWCALKMHIAHTTHTLSCQEECKNHIFFPSMRIIILHAHTHRHTQRERHVTDGKNVNFLLCFLLLYCHFHFWYSCMPFFIRCNLLFHLFLFFWFVDFFFIRFSFIWRISNGYGR